MKNITNVNELQKCYYCGLRGFFCGTPFGADYESCPCCGNNDFLNTAWTLYDKNKEQYKKYEKYECLFDFYDKCDEKELYNEMRLRFRYCNKCNIIFILGCMHNHRGCTDDIFNAHFIQKWKDKSTNIIYEGMPHFTDENDWFDNVNNVEVIKMYCPHKKTRCNNSHYEITEHLCSL